MKMLKILTLPLKVVLFLLMLTSSNSSYSFSAHSPSPQTKITEAFPDVESTNKIDEQVNSLYNSILPVQKDLILVKGSLNSVGNYRSSILWHTSTSLGYIKRSRNIYPNLSIREVIYPFHVFL